MEKLSESIEFENNLDLEGFEVKHRTFGIGTIVSNEGRMVQVKFQNNEPKWLVEPEAKLIIISRVDSVQQDFEETFIEQEESKSDTDKLEDRINELEQNVRLEKSKRNDILILIGIGGFFPFLFWIGAFGTCLDC